MLRLAVEKHVLPRLLLEAGACASIFVINYTAHLAAITHAAQRLLRPIVSAWLTVIALAVCVLMVRSASKIDFMQNKNTRQKGLRHKRALAGSTDEKIRKSQHFLL